MPHSVDTALEAVYQSLRQDNLDIDNCIRDLKQALAAEQQHSVTVDPSKLAQNNRQGRKMMQSYFKKRGVSVVFSETTV